MVSKGMTLVKYLLFAFNLLFALSGLALLVIGAIIQALYHSYNHFVDPRLFYSPTILIIVGVVVFIVAFFGCCGAIKENHCMVVTFSVLLVIIFVLEVAGGITGYVLKDDVNKVMEENLNQLLEEYPVSEEYNKAWNVLQYDLHCCGVKRPEDWKKVFLNETLPWSCCSPASNASAIYEGNDQVEPAHCSMAAVMLADEGESGVYHTGCLDALVGLLTKNAVVIGAVCLTIAFIQIVGVAFSCCLARSIRREYETV
ncbi:CD63 antigen-like [Ischnura elegans]|uniref:CD63 antigen-like n=1 Tax=Ischnura elegans TaxID=197161 RepID=UPI001ED88252|nr:CD63 antigen-like [Ischnura elegans]